ncbi:hypothetical protein GCM10023093_27700 [Nemorincola caseinilytica]|uniref:Uncharacterized protein n=2 Tax=Nemorincola caseinilytica TaxID=2054315 RepID=A0ABP8NP00_9BACT
MLARFIERRHFLHGMLVGLISTAWSVLICITLWESYVAHHTDGTDPYTKLAKVYGITVPRAMLFLGMFNALLSAVVTGAFTHAAGKIMHKVRGW